MKWNVEDVGDAYTQDGLLYRPILIGDQGRTRMPMLLGLLLQGGIETMNKVTSVDTNVGKGLSGS